MEKSLIQLANETEAKMIEHMELESVKILEELERKIGYSLGIKNLDTLISLLFDTQFIDRLKLVQLLKNHQVNERDLLIYLTTIFSRYFHERLPRMQRMVGLMSLPYIKNITSSSNHYHIITNYGVLDMYCLEDWLAERKIDFQPKMYNGYCHHAVKLLAPSLRDDYITTSEFDGLFGGIYYHSYYSLKDGGVVDPSRNIFYPGHCFEDVFKPKELLKYPASEFESRYREYHERELHEDKGLCEVLALALDQKRKLLK